MKQIWSKIAKDSAQWSGTFHATQWPSPLHTWINLKRRKIMFFRCLQKSQGLLYILFRFILTRTISDRHDYLQFLVEKNKSQEDYLLNATRVGWRGPGLKCRLLYSRNISYLSMLYCPNPGCDNKDSKSRRYHLKGSGNLIVWKRHRHIKNYRAMKYIELKLRSALSPGNEPTF